MPASRYHIEALARGLEILALFTPERSSLNLTEIVAATQLNKSTAFRVVSTLETLGYLERDPATRCYRPGLKVLQLGFTVISGLEVQQVARPYLERLAQRARTNSSLSVLDGLEVVYVDRVRGQSIVGILLGLGSRIPAHCASMGKAMLAHLPPEELEARLAQTTLEPCTAKSIADPAALREELGRVRQRGYAVNDEELVIGLRSVAAPIWDNSARAIAAINVSGSVGDVSSERLVYELAPEVVRTAQEISRALGYRPDQRSRS